MAFGDKIWVWKITWHGWPYLFIFALALIGKQICYQSISRAHSMYAPCQWEMTWHCNAASDWLGAYTEWSLNFYPGHSYIAKVRTGLLKDRPWRISMQIYIYAICKFCLWYPCKKKWYRVILVRVISKVTCMMTRHFAKIKCTSRLHNDVINRNAPHITVHF